MIWKLGQESAGALARKKSVSMKQKLKNLWEIEKMLQKSRISSIFFPPHLQVTVTSTLYGMRWWSAGLLPLVELVHPLPLDENENIWSLQLLLVTN